MSINQSYVLECVNSVRYNIVAFLNNHNSDESEYYECIQLVQKEFFKIPGGHSGGHENSFKNIFTDILYDLEEKHGINDIGEKLSINLTEFFDRSTIPQADQCISIIENIIENIPDGNTSGESISYIKKIFTELILHIKDMNKPI